MLLASAASRIVLQSREWESAFVWSCGPFFSTCVGFHPHVITRLLYDSHHLIRRSFPRHMIARSLSHHNIKRIGDKQTSWYYGKAAASRARLLQHFRSELPRSQSQRATCSYTATSHCDADDPCFCLQQTFPPLSLSTWVLPAVKFLDSCAYRTLAHHHYRQSRITW